MLTVCNCAEDDYRLLMSSVGALLDDVHGDIAGSWKLDVPVSLWCYMEQQNLSQECLTFVVGKC